MPAAHKCYSFLSFALLATTIFLAGCASDQYFMVPKNDLNTLNANLGGQRAELSSLLVTSAARQDVLVRQGQERTEGLH